jgi:putative membrane protein
MWTHLADHPGWNGEWSGPGWWIVVPILFWAVVLGVGGYLVYRRTPKQAARAAAERTLAERFARGEIDADELRDRRTVLRRRG